MQQLRKATVARAAADRCARELLSNVPAAMRFVRSQMRTHRQAELTVAQFRALVFLNANEEPSLSALAEHLGLSLPAASRMVELLVKRGLMQRKARPGDRRSVALTLTGSGQTALRTALRATQAALARRFDALSAGELSLVGQAMRILGRLFAAEDGRTQAAK